MNIENLLNLMRLKGCSLEKLADGLKMQYTNVAKIFNGDRPLSKRFFERALFFLHKN